MKIKVYLKNETNVVERHDAPDTNKLCVKNFS